MQRQQIIDLAREAGLANPLWVDYDYAIIERFAQLVAKAKLDEIATELLKGPVNDTAASIAIWIREQA